MDIITIIKLISVAIVIMMFIFLCLEIFFRKLNLGIHWNIDEFGNRESLHSQQITDSRLRIVCVGDSLTFGTRLKERDSYPMQLREKLRNQLGSTVDVRNAGISGHTSIQVLERVKRDVIKFCPDIVVIWIGTNDGMLKRTSDSLSKRPFDRPPALTHSVFLTTIYSLECIMPIMSFMYRLYSKVRDQTTRVKIDEFNAALWGIIHKLKLAGIKKIIIINIPIIPHHLTSSEKHRLHRQSNIYSKYNSIITDIATIYNADVIDLTLVLSNKKRRVFLQDGLHLTSYGYKVIAGAVYQKIINFLNIS